MLPELALFTLLSYDVVGTATSHPALMLEREVVTVAFGDEDFERFDVVHVSTPWSSLPMLMPTPSGFGSGWYESTDDYADSLPARLAYFGIDLWIVEQRRGTVGTLPLGSCLGDPLTPDPPPVDCSPLGAWTVADEIADVSFVRDELVESPHVPTIGGHWTGGALALASVDAHPEDFAGVLVWEGTLYTQEAYTLAKNAAACDFLETIPDAFGADLSVANEQVAANLARINPDGLSPFPPEVLAPFGLTAGVATNLDVLHAIFIAEAPTLLDRVSEGLLFMVGTIEDGPSVAELDQVFNVIDLPPSTTYASLGVIRDYICGLGGDPAYTSNLAAFEGDVFVIGSQRGLDDELQDTLEGFTNARLRYADYRGELGVHDLLWSDLREQVDVEIVAFNVLAQL